MNLIHVPIELLEERYSQQWFQWFSEAFLKSDTITSYIDVLPELGLNAKIETGQFLDVIKTNTFKAQQLEAITLLFQQNKITADTVFFFTDAWFPGLEMLSYIRDALKIPFKIVGIVHAGTWDKYDYIYQVGMQPWGQYCEKAWLTILDAVFVATQFHKNLILESHPGFEQKIYVTGLPIFPTFVKPLKKEKIIVFPHRLAPEKQPELFDQLRDQFRDVFDDWQLVKTKDVCNTKQEYYDLLNQAQIAVSFAQQETFGIAMLEATLCGCIPIVPNRLSYTELYPSVFHTPQSQNISELELTAVCLYHACYVLDHMDEYPAHPLQMQWEHTARYIEELGKQAIPNMLRVMKDL